MKNFFATFVKDEQGQDLIEYTLLLAFVALASAALFTSAGKSVSSIWSHCQQQPVERRRRRPPARTVRAGGTRRTLNPSVFRRNQSI